MIAMSNTQPKASEYRGLAAEATASAGAATLPNVRERHEAAAARWINLALLNEPHAGRRTDETKRRLIRAALPGRGPCAA
jgi:hypothetical protein